MKTILLLCLLSLAWPLQAAETLKLGVFPYLSAAQLIKQHKPLADYLSQQLDMNVTISSATDFPGFLRRTREGRYDVVLTAPHMGALAIRRDGYQPLAVARNKLHAVIASNRNSDWTELRQLKNARIILPPKKAIISLLALDTLNDEGLNSDQLDIRYTQSHNNALQSVIMRRSDAAAFSSPTYQRYLDQGGNELRVLATSGDIPSNFLVANSDLDSGLTKRLRQALLEFDQTSTGRQYFKRTRQLGFRPIVDNDLERLRPFVKRIFGFAY